MHNASNTSRIKALLFCTSTAWLIFTWLDVYAMHPIYIVEYYVYIPLSKAAHRAERVQKPLLTTLTQ